MTRPERGAVGFLALLAFVFIAWRIVAALAKIAIGLLTLALAVVIFLVRMAALEWERWRLMRQIGANRAAPIREHNAS